MKKIESSLQVYFKEIQNHKILTPEEEKKLARKARLGDKKAKKELAGANLRFVVSVAKRYRNMGTPFSDLINAGNVGLIKATEKFDERKGVRFLSYAVWWIRQSIMKLVTEHIKSYRLPMSRASRMLKVKKTKEKIRGETGREPTREEIAEELDLAPEKITKTFETAKNDISLDATIANTDDLAFLDVISKEVETPEEKYYSESYKEIIKENLDKLNPRDRKIVIYYFGLYGKNPHTLSEVGNILGVSRERVRQLRNRGLMQLREHINLDENLIP